MGTKKDVVLLASQNIISLVLILFFFLNNDAWKIEELY